jgi:UDP-N-acetylmuramate--alanine ligase
VNLPGTHNVLNSLAAIAVASELGITDAAIQSGLARFQGVDRRLQFVGELATGTGKAVLIDDYGHHPVEIAAVLTAARQAVAGNPGARIIAVHQPHRYTRLASLFDDFCTCFNEADVVAIADVYSAGEDPIAGASRDDLVAGLIAHGHRHGSPFSRVEQPARADRRDLAALGLFFGGVGQNDATGGGRLGINGLNHHAIVKRLQAHGILLLELCEPQIGAAN